MKIDIIIHNENDEPLVVKSLSLLAALRVLVDLVKTPA